MSGKVCKIHVLNLGLAFGVTWGLGIFVLGLCAAFFNWGNDLVEGFGSLYIGYDATFLGSIIGGVWAVVDGFIFGVILAFFYNLFCRCCPGEKGKEE